MYTKFDISITHHPFYQKKKASALEFLWVEAFCFQQRLDLWDGQPLRFQPLNLLQAGDRLFPREPPGEVFLRLLKGQHPLFRVEL